jgi:3-methyladenine DNA glycosylase AlkD
LTQILEDLRKRLESLASERVRLQSTHFFKEEVLFHGLKSDQVRDIAKGYYLKIKNEGKEHVFALCDELWHSPYFEVNIIACLWSENQNKNFVADDLALFEKWLNNNVSNWATCDTLCNHTIGDLIMMYPDKINELKRWALSSNRWMRRGAAVSLIVPARKGLFLPEIFEIATILLKDTDDMVQKGYGWMLKVASQIYQQQVYGFVMHHRACMPRTALRYAIEKMPPALRAAAMEKQ